MHYSYSKPEIGSSISINDKLVKNNIFLLVFISTFCSRCIVLKKMLKNFDNDYQKLPVVFVDIATKEFLKFRIKIELVPAVLLIKSKYY